MTAGPKAWVNGRIVAADEPALPVTDRGFQLGDGLFETLRARRGVPIEWAEHVERLAEGGRALALALPDARELLAALGVLLGAAGLDGSGEDGVPPGDASVRITASRGSIPSRGTLPAGWRDADVTLVIQAWPFAPPAPALLERGVRAVTSSVVRDPASPLAGIKTTSRADSVLARLEADRAGVDEAIYANPDGGLAEATSANLFGVFESRLVTPPPSAGVLVGTTRTWLLAHAADAAPGIRAEERPIRPGELLAADEAFLSSSVAGIVPLVELDGRPIGDGRPGARTRTLRAAREEWIDAVSVAGPSGAT